MLSSTPVRGAIPRIERQQAHYEFLWAVRPPFAMIDLVHGARIAMHDGDFFPPETSVILTSTIADETLAEWSFEDELRLIRALEPAYVIPFDFPVYDEMPTDTRETHVQQIADGVRDMAMLLDTLEPETAAAICDQTGLPYDLVAPPASTTVLPLVKGATPGERQTLIEAAHDIDAPMLVKYGVQYMTVGSNGSHPQLCADLETLATESEGYPVLLIGLASPSGRLSLEGVPDTVVAAAGMNQWVSRVEPRSSSPADMRAAFEDYYNAVAETLETIQEYRQTIGAGSSDDPPAPFASSPGHAVGADLSASLAGASAEGGYGFGERKRPDSAADAVTAALQRVSSGSE